MAAVNEPPRTSRVLPYERLRELHLVDSIPVSVAGKVLPVRLR
jgi:hypothetical protein